MIIFKNYLAEEQFKKLQTAVLSNLVNWEFVKNTAYPQCENNVLDYSWCNVAIEEGKQISNLYDATKILLQEMYLNNINYGKVYRARYGLITAQKETVVHLPHVDYDFPHKVCLFYIDGCDGDTLIYNLKYNYGSLNSFDYYQINNANVSVSHTIKPEPNTLVIFDGAYYHSSSTPLTTSRRIVLNINLV